MCAIQADDAPLPQERTRADFENQSRDRIEYDLDVQTEQLFWRLLSEPDLKTRIALAYHFRSWSFANRTAVYFLPALLTRMQEDHDAFAEVAGDIVGKLLCQEDEELWPGVLEACARVLFDTGGKRSLLHEVSLGKNVCVKLLIDVADHAEREGDSEYASLALSAVDTLVGRNFDDHPVIGGIVLYRLFDVTGVVLGWAIRSLKSGNLRTKVPPFLMIPVIDDLGEERPLVVPHVIDCLAVPAAETAEEYRERLELIENSRSWAGRAAGLEILGLPPKGHSELWAPAVAAVDESIEHPVGGWSADRALYALVRGMEDDRTGAVDELVERRGETLSYRVKREYIRRRPDTDLLDTSEPYYWQSDPERELDEEIERQVRRYEDCLRAALDRRSENRNEINRLKEEGRRLDAPIFLREEPATISVPDHLNEELQQARQEAATNDLNRSIEELQETYNRRIEQLSAEMMENLDDTEVTTRCSAEMARLGEELAKNLEELLGGS